MPWICTCIIHSQTFRVTDCLHRPRASCTFFSHLWLYKTSISHDHVLGPLVLGTILLKVGEKEIKKKDHKFWTKNRIQKGMTFQNSYTKNIIWRICKQRVSVRIYIPAGTQRRNNVESTSTTMNHAMRLPVNTNMNQIVSAIALLFHYENTPIQIYRKFYLQKLKIFK